MEKRRESLAVRQERLLRCRRLRLLKRSTPRKVRATTSYRGLPNWRPPFLSLCLPAKARARRATAENRAFFPSKSDTHSFPVFLFVSAARGRRSREKVDVEASFDWLYSIIGPARQASQSAFSQPSLPQLRHQHAAVSHRRSLSIHTTTPARGTIGKTRLPLILRLDTPPPRRRTRPTLAP